MARDTFYSRESAGDVVDQLCQALSEQTSDAYVMIELVTYEEGREITHPAIFIRPCEDTGTIILANSAEIVQCIDREGHKVSVVLGKPSPERYLAPAEIIVELK